MKRRVKPLLLLVSVIGSFNSSNALSKNEVSSIELFPAEYGSHDATQELRFLSPTPLRLGIEKFRVDYQKLEVALWFSADSAKDLEEVTKTFLNKRLAIVVNQRVVSSPIIKAPIENDLVLSFKKRSELDVLVDALNS